MDNFHEILVLIYLNEYKDDYMLSEIKDLCNFSTAKLKSCIEKMKENKLVDSQSGKLSVSKAGEHLLKVKNLLNVSIDDLFEDTVTLNFLDEKLYP